MNQSSFNTLVRSLNHCSVKKNAESEKTIVDAVAKDLGMKNIGFCSLGSKHDNHGFLVCEKDGADQEKAADDVIVDGLCLLSFCPVY